MTDEWIPILVGFCLGALVLIVRRGLPRVLAGAAGIMFAGLAAALLSGEYQISWVYLLVDVAETAAGFGTAVAAVQFLRRALVAYPSRKAGQECVLGH